MALCAPLSPVQAAVVVSNLTEGYDTFGRQTIAQSFTVGSTRVTLADVQLILNSDVGPSRTTTAVKIRANRIASGGNRPGALVANLTNPTSFTAGIQTFTAPANTRLSANTTYWVTVNEGLRSGTAIRYTLTSNRERGQTGWSIGNQRFYTFDRTISNSTRWYERSTILRMAIRDSSSESNTAPTAANKAVTVNEDMTYTFGAADFGFMDADTGDTLQNVAIVTTPGAGVLALNRVGVAPPVSVSQDSVITKADIDASRLTFTPVRNAYGDGYASFTFRVSDGFARSASTYTMTINVTAVNDPATTMPPFTGRALASNLAEFLAGRRDHTSAQVFRTGPQTGGYVLSGVQILLVGTQPSDGSRAAFVKIMENGADNRPGALVTNLSNPRMFVSGAGTPASPPLVNTFTAPPNTRLSANTIYWVVINDGTSQRLGYAQSRSDNFESEQGCALPATRLERSGTSWTNDFLMSQIAILGDSAGNADMVDMLEISARRG